MDLKKLFHNVPDLLTPAERIPSLEISQVVFDSRKVKPGSLFVAMKGLSSDAHAFIPDAIQRGASAVTGMEPLDLGKVPYIQVTDSRQALAYISSNWYDNPSRKMTVIGVTGTDGKTTTTNLIDAILRHAGLKTGMVSTVNAVIGDKELDTGFHVTTPDAPDLQFYLSEMVKAGVTHAILETTSHGLAQHRADACDFDIGVVTNVTHEHLDFHGDYDHYLESKALLFHKLSETAPKNGKSFGIGVLNADDRSYPALSAINGFEKITYSVKDQADLYAQNVHIHQDGMEFDVVTKLGVLHIKTHLVGEYNIANILAVLGACLFGLRIEPKLAAEGISKLKAIPGRMETIDLGQNFHAVVDFAHTPFALEAALHAGRATDPQRVIVVFGSAGLRDRAKRRMMAATAVQKADISIFTAEDPRTESLADILAEMADEAVAHGGVEGDNFYRIGDRRDAIRFALQLAEPGDLVMACGKGHEQSMCFGTTEYAWDDRLAMKAALAELLQIPGYEMPYLPEA